MKSINWLLWSALVAEVVTVLQVIALSLCYLLSKIKAKSLKINLWMLVTFRPIMKEHEPMTCTIENILKEGLWRSNTWPTGCVQLLHRHMSQQRENSPWGTGAHSIRALSSSTTLLRGMAVATLWISSCPFIPAYLLHTSELSFTLIHYWIVSSGNVTNTYTYNELWCTQAIF